MIAKQVATSQPRNGTATEVMRILQMTDKYLKYRG
jgi:hypothetical protein